jgi:hypothetical protein
VEIFTVTGTYAAQGPVVINSCGIGDPVGNTVIREIAMTDSRPTLTGRVGLIPLQGTLTSGGGFNMSQTSTSSGITTVVRVEGSMIATPQGNVGFSGRATISFSGGVLPPCSIAEDLIGARFTTVATSRVPSAMRDAWTSGDENAREVLLRKMSFLEAQ